MDQHITKSLHLFLYCFCLQINVWKYVGHKLWTSVDTGHSSNIFCTKFIPETSDEIVASGAGDAEVKYMVLNI